MLRGALWLGVGLVLPFLIVRGGDAAETTVPTYDHAQVLVYRDEAGREHPVKTREEWRRRRQHILEGMEQAAGKLPSRDQLPPLDVKVLDERPGDGFTRLTITFVAEEGDRVPAHLYVPVQTGEKQRLPAMLALHPTGPLGKGIVANEGPRANRGYALELAQRGYVVIAPDYPSFGDYKDYDFASDRYVSGAMKGIFNHMRCVDLLQARDDVDPERIGAIGHSLGGHNAMFVGVFDERIQVTVSSCGWTPFHDYYGGKIKGWTSDRYMPLLETKYALDPSRVPFDFYELVAALAPRPFFSSSPVRDSNFDVQGVKKAVPVAQPVYALYGAADNLRVIYPECDHDFPDAVRREAYEFIDRALRFTPRRQVP